MSAAVAEQADAGDLDELAAAEPPPCQLVLVLGCTCGRGCPEIERACGRPSVAVVDATCPACGIQRVWVCQECVELLPTLFIPRVCECGAPVALKVTSS